ncbi:SDR family NAD(P)-dependent oxidoreductase [Mesorhizobium sp. M1365]
MAAASSGLGLATAEKLANEGCRLSISGWDPGRLERAVDRLRSTGAEVLARAIDVVTARIQQLELPKQRSSCIARTRRDSLC